MSSNHFLYVSFKLTALYEPHFQENTCAMKCKGEGIKCEHACMHAFASCKECFLSLYKEYLVVKKKKLSKKKYFNPNFHCPSLGLDCACEIQKIKTKRKPGKKI